MGSLTSKLEIYDEEDIREMLNFGFKIVIYKNIIYDIKHIEEHPGGMDIIDENIGTDITYHMKFHSKKALKQLLKYPIGKIK